MTRRCTCGHGECPNCWLDMMDKDWPTRHCKCNHPSCWQCNYYNTKETAMIEDSTHIVLQPNQFNPPAGPLSARPSPLPVSVTPATSVWYKHAKAWVATLGEVGMTREMAFAVALIDAYEAIAPMGAKFHLGQRVTKIKGSQWTGKVVGFYFTDLTPIGYSVESEKEKGSVQVWPEAALREASHA